MSYTKSITLIRLKRAKEYIENLTEEEFEYYRDNLGVQLEPVLDKYNLTTIVRGMEFKDAHTALDLKYIGIQGPNGKNFTLYQFYAVYFKMDFSLVYTLFYPRVSGLNQYDKPIQPLLTETTLTDYIGRFTILYKKIKKGKYDHLINNKQAEVYSHVQYSL